MQRALDSIEGGINPNVVSGSDMQRALDLNKAAPSAYPFQPNAVNNLLSSLGLPAESNAAVERYLAANQNIAPTGYTFQTNAVQKMLDSLGLPPEQNKAVEKYLAANQNIAPAYTTDNVINQLAESIPIGGPIDYNPAERQTTTDAANAAYQKALTDAAQAAAEARFQSLANETDAEREQRINFTPYPNVPQTVETLSPEEKMKAYNDAVDARLTQEKINREAAARAIIENNPALSEQEARVQKMLEQTPGESFKSYFGYEPETTPKSEEEQKKELEKIIQSFLSDTPSSFIGPATLLAGTDYTGGIPSTTIGDYSFGREPIGPDTSGFNLGSLDANGMLKTFPGATDQTDLPSLLNPTQFPDLGMITTQNVVYGPDGTAYSSPAQAIANGVTNYSMSPPADLSTKTYYDNSLAGDKGFDATGGFGNVWRNAEGLPIKDAEGNSWQTGQGSQQQSLNDRVNQTIKDAQIAAGEYTGFSGPVFGPAPAPAPAPSPPSNDNNSESGGGRGGGRSNDGGDGGNAAGNAAAQARSGDNSATSGGWMGGGGADARGGYLQHGRFHQHPYAHGGIAALSPYNLGSYSDGGRLLKGPGDGVSDSIPATIGQGQPARLADGEFVIPARIVSELGNGSTDAGAKRLYEMMDRIQKVRRKTKNVAANTKAAKYLPA
jgi:hypothetical protein